MIQDIGNHRFHNEYYPEKKISPGDVLFFFRGKELLVKKNGAEYELLRYFDDKEDGIVPAPQEDAVVYLFSVDETCYFGVRNPVDVPEGYTFVSLRSLRKSNLREHETMFPILTAYHLMTWYSKNRFCGACGSPTKPDKKERMLRCPNCGNMIFPRINPAVIVGVKNKDKLLLTQYAASRGVNYYALIAGFTEIGETMEETVAREVYEEAGIRVKNIRYYKSQPWGSEQDILMGFYCEVDGDDTIHMDAEELQQAKWVAREEIELQPDDYSLTNEMMLRFKEGKEQ